MTPEEIKKALVQAWQKTKGTLGSATVDGLREVWVKKGYLTAAQQDLLRLLAATGQGRPEGRE